MAKSACREATTKNIKQGCRVPSMQSKGAESQACKARVQSPKHAKQGCRVPSMQSKGAESQASKARVQKTLYVDIHYFNHTHIHSRESITAITTKWTNITWVAFLTFLTLSNDVIIIVLAEQTFFFTHYIPTYIHMYVCIFITEPNKCD